jgi:gluconate 2-dehydrogenase gamma chain
VPSAIFFETLLANTIEGYFADPSYGGNRDMVGWRMIGFPGAYAAYLPVYTHHGMRFEREPMSIGDHARAQQVRGEEGHRHG